MNTKLNGWMIIVIGFVVLAIGGSMDGLFGTVLAAAGFVVFCIGIVTIIGDAIRAVRQPRVSKSYYEENETPVYEDVQAVSNEKDEYTQADGTLSLSRLAIGAAILGVMMLIIALL